MMQCGNQRGAAQQEQVGRGAEQEESRVHGAGRSVPRARLQARRAVERPSSLAEVRHNNNNNNTIIFWLHLTPKLTNKQMGTRRLVSSFLFVCLLFCCSFVNQSIYIDNGRQETTQRTEGKCVGVMSPCADERS